MVSTVRSFPTSPPLLGPAVTQPLQIVPGTESQRVACVAVFMNLVVSLFFSPLLKYLIANSVVFIHRLLLPFFPFKSPSHAEQCFVFLNPEQL